MTVNYRSVAPLALAGIAIAATPLVADSINLFQSPSEAKVEREDDCIAEQDRWSSSAEFDSVYWSFGQLTWRWTPASVPMSVNLLCVDRTAVRSSFGVATQLQMMAAAGSTSSRWRTEMGAPAYVDGALTPVVEVADAIDIGGPPVVGGIGSIDLPGVNDLPYGIPFFSAWPGGEVSAWPFGEVVLAPVGQGTGHIAIASNSSAGADDPPITLDPREWARPEDMAPVPEPGTWLLTGTGLAAAWRAARKRR